MKRLANHIPRPIAKTMNTKPASPILSISLLLQLLLSFSKCNAAFTVDLIHRDSLHSPLHNPSLSPSQRLSNAIRRSFQRARHLNSPQSKMYAISGEYLMNYSIGTPPFHTLGMVDTGSDLIWTQCQPCLDCFNQTLKIFTPNESSTYTRIGCHTQTCISLGTMSSCSKTRDNCLYDEGFGDGSYTMGELATDVVSLSSVHVPNVTIGCGFANYGLYMSTESGIVGLGVGNLSLVNQLGQLAEGRFTYCLALQNFNESVVKSGKISFGASVLGEGVVSTPFVVEFPNSHYSLTLEGMSVGTKRVDIYHNAGDSKSDSNEGNMIIDSGTTLLYIPNKLYVALKEAVTKSINLKRTTDPEEEELELCYYTRKDIVGLPNVTFHFKGADLEMKSENLLIRTNDVCVCLAAVGVSEEEGFGIFGLVGQMNFLVGYDLEKETVSFKPTDCSKG